MYAYTQFFCTLVFCTVTHPRSKKSVQTISGTGANHLAALFLAKFYQWNGPKQVFISNPTWGMEISHIYYSTS